MKRLAVFWKLTEISLAVFLICASAVMAQDKKKDDPTRSVQGVVTSPADTVVKSAVVYLKNTKTLQIRSFLTKEDGTYYFHGLSPDVDYELKAEAEGLSSSDKTLSAFDNRRQAVINLKLNAKR